MDCQLSTSLLPGIWVIETLAWSNHIDVPLLLDLLKIFPQTSDDIGRKARDLVSFRILESFLFQGAQSDSMTSSSPKIAFDKSESCEDVLLRILRETPSSSLKVAGPEMSKWDIQAFIALKRSTFDTHTLQKLKDAILTGSNSFLASLKETSGLSFGNEPESGFLVNGRTDSNPRISESNGQLISPAVTSLSYLVQNDKSNENLSLVKQKEGSTTGEKSTKGQIESKDGSEGKYENNIVHCEQDFGGRVSSSVANTHSLDTSMTIGQDSEIERCGLERITDFRGTGADGPPEEDNNERTSLKDIGGVNEVLHCKNRAPHCDIDSSNDKSDDERVLKIETREPKSNRGRSESDIKDYAQSSEGEEKIQDLHSDTELPDDKYHLEDGENEIIEVINDVRDLNSIEERDKSEPHSKDSVRSEREEGIHNGCDGNSSATNCSGLNLLVDACTGVDEVNQHRTCLGSVGYDKVMHHREQVCNHNTKQNHEDENAGDDESFLEPKTSRRCKDGSELEFHRNAADTGNPEDVVSGDSDGCLDERTDIATKKTAFLSSQCSFSQGSIDYKELNVCVKCNKGGQLKVCNANSCRMVVHESCLGFHASFSSRGEFLCPFCAYSQAISEYMDIKEKASLARKDFATFVCLGGKKEFNKQHHRSYGSKQHEFVLEHSDGLNRSIKPNNQYNAGRINNNKRRRKLEYDEAGYSSLSSGDSSPPGGKATDSAKPKDHPSKKHKSEMENMTQTPQSTGDHGQSDRAAPAILRPKRESASEKYKRPYTYQEIPQLRRKKVPWTTEEEEKLKEGVRKLYTPHKRLIPWKEILDFGSTVFLGRRTTIDLKDKWRNLGRGSPK